MKPQRNFTNMKKMGLVLLKVPQKRGFVNVRGGSDIGHLCPMSRADPMPFYLLILFSFRYETLIICEFKITQINCYSI